MSGAKALCRHQARSATATTSGSATAPTAIMSRTTRPRIGGKENTVYVRVRNRACPGHTFPNCSLCMLTGRRLRRRCPGRRHGTAAWPIRRSAGRSATARRSPRQRDLSISLERAGSSDYAAFGADQAHFSLLTRIVTSSTPPYGMTVPETGNVAANVVNNNDIAWKNISVVEQRRAGHVRGCGGWPVRGRAPSRPLHLRAAAAPGPTISIGAS